MSQTTETKEQKIVDTALRLIHRHGYRKVTMSDIAEASGMSRPSLYASFENKEAVLNGLMAIQTDRYDLETQRRLEQVSALRDRLRVVFEVWMIEPVASVIDSENGIDLLRNTASYAPQAVDTLYARFEGHLIAVLTPAVTSPETMTAQDLAHILMLATKGLKASTESLAEFQRMIDGLVAMAVATVGSV